ncbi:MULTISPECIES: DUF6257 family protein [Streptomyces]|uniref:Uncharacterized protein n=1 Tax=Streptomyces viridochromogenes TaxID=1938 RepID=A0A0L8K235_STRVR|nr:MULTISPECIES: DUF6257 family protein [Streptomyces]KOG20000.1 hypothetical protein ADK34_24150 [Streptomyces viridochromogenes]
MPQDPNYPKLTAGEHARIAWNVARMCKRSIAGDTVHQGDLEKKVDRIIDRARKRADQNDGKRK